MKLCVFGAGAVGGHIAGRLARGGAEVCVVARGAHLAAIRADGLRVSAPDIEVHARLPAGEDPAEFGPQDAVIVTVKAPALPRVAARIGPLLRPDTPVVFAMNGVPWWYFHGHGGPDEGRRLARLDPGGALWDGVGPGRAVGGVVYSACTVTEPGVVHVEHARNRVVLGEPSGGITPRVEAVAGALRAGGLTVEVSDRIRDRVWSKLLLNLGTGPMGVLTDAGPRALFEEAACRDAARRVVAEGAAIARAWGCRVEPDVEGQIENGRRSEHLPSIVQDSRLGRPMEIAAIFEAPLDLARMRDVEAPTLALLVALARVRTRAAGLHGG